MKLFKQLGWKGSHREKQINQPTSTPQQQKNQPTNPQHNPPFFKWIVSESMVEKVCCHIEITSTDKNCKRKLWAVEKICFRFDHKLYWHFCLHICIDDSHLFLLTKVHLLDFERQLQNEVTDPLARIKQSWFSFQTCSILCMHEIANRRRNVCVFH